MKSRLELEIDSRSGERRLRRMERGLERVENQGNQTARATRNIGVALRAAGGAFVGISAGTGVLLAMGRQASQTAAEIQKLSRIAGTSTGDFQRLSYGAAQYGVEQQKLADILRDTQDRIGDFLQTGAGEFVDFFEQIAPQADLTAEALARMSGPDALQAIYNALENANLSASEMTFYMEALASDATELIPLLRDSGAEVDRLGQEADEFNAVLSDLELQRLKDVRNEFSQLEQQLTTETARAVSQFDDLMKSSLEGISEGVNAVARGFNLFMDDFRDNEVKRSIAGINDELDRVFDDKRRLELRIDQFGVDSAQGQQAKDALTAVKQEYDALIDRKKELQNTPPPVTEPEVVRLARVTNQYKTLDQWLFNIDDSAGGASSSISRLSDSESEAARQAEQFASSLQSLEDRLFPAEAAQRQLRQEQIMLQTALMQGRIGIERYLEAWQRLQEAQRSQQDPSQAYGGQGFGSQIGQGGLGGMQEGGSQWDRWLESAQNAFTDFDAMAANTAESSQRGFGNAFESMVFDSENFGDAMHNLFDGIARTLVRSLGEMAAQWLAYQAVQQMVGKNTSSLQSAGMISRAAAKQQEAALNAYAATAAIPVVGPALAPAAAGTAMASTAPFVAAISSLSSAGVVGQAHDGWDSLPRSGTYNLEKGERVTSASLNRDLTRFLDRENKAAASQERGRDSRQAEGGIELNIVNNGQPVQVESARERRDGDKRILDVVLGSLDSDGRMYSGMVRKFDNLKKRGR